MTTFKAIAHEDIPANRLIQLYRPKENTDKVYLKLAVETAGAEFVSKKDLKKDEETTVTVSNSVTWEVEAGGVVEAGVPVVGGKDGTVVRDIRGEINQAYSIGYSINRAEKGEIVTVVRSSKPSPAWVRKTNEATGIKPEPEKATEGNKDKK